MTGNQIIVTGIVGDSITSEQKLLLGQEHDALVCTASNYRLLQCCLHSVTESNWIAISPISACLKLVKEALKQGNVIFFTSGDPLFYGIGKLLLETFSPRQIRFVPSVSSMQYCFSRFKIAWDQAVFVSLHGRNISELSGKLNEQLLFIFTDSTNTPNAIATHIRDTTGRTESSCYTMYVGEMFGTDSEKLTTGNPEQIAQLSFEQPNVLIVKKQQNSALSHAFGLTEKQIQHSRGLITKNEVRASVLHSLALPHEGVFWDIGAGSGSISIEASRMNPLLSIYSIEKNRHELENLACNRTSFSCWNMNVIAGDAPDILPDLPTPDCVFIGGSGGRLVAILEYLSGRIKNTHKIVVTGVIEKTCTIAPEILHKAGYTVAVSIVSTKRYKYPSGEVHEFNPIHIITATR